MDGNKQHKFDIVLTDLNLPDSSADETVQRLRVLNENIPIIAMTGVDHLTWFRRRRSYIG